MLGHRLTKRSGTRPPRRAPLWQPPEGAESHAGVARCRCPALGCRTGDSRRREFVSALRCRLREAGSRFDALPFDGAVHGGAAAAEELGDLKGAVVATVHQGDQVGFRLPVEFGLLAAQPTLCLGDLHALDRAKPNQSDSNSATIARTLNSSRPTASVGS